METDKPFFIIKNQRFLTTIRRFEVIEDYRNIFIKGDILEEYYDEPNTFCNISLLKRKNDDGSFKIYGEATIEKKILYFCSTLSLINLNLFLFQDNKNNFNITREDDTVSHFRKIFESIKEIEPIDVKDSECFKALSRLALRNYKSKMKKLAKLKEDLTNLKYMLEIKD